MIFVLNVLLPKKNTKIKKRSKIFYCCIVKINIKYKHKILKLKYVIALGDIL